MSNTPGIVKTKIIATLLILVPIGFYTKSYGGPGSAWVQNYSGGILYEIFWCLIAILFLSRVSPEKIASGVLIATSAIECLQLWHTPILETLRATVIGHLILGSFFDPWDFPHYIIGSTLGWFAMTSLHTGNRT